MNFLVPLALKDKEMKYIAASAKLLGEYLRMPIVRKRVVLLPRFSAEWGKPRSSIELLRFATFLCARFTIYTDEDVLLAVTQINCCVITLRIHGVCIFPTSSLSSLAT